MTNYASSRFIRLAGDDYPDRLAIRKTLFTGSSNTTYPVASTNGVYWDVLINGIQLAGTDYSVASNTLTINVTPIPSDTIEVISYTGVDLTDIPQNVEQTKTVFTNTTNTVFTVDPNDVVYDVFFNGLRLTNTYYTASGGTVTLTSLTPNANDEIEVVGFSGKEFIIAGSVSNNYLISLGYTTATGDVSNTYLQGLGYGDVSNNYMQSGTTLLIKDSAGSTLKTIKSVP